MRSKPKRSKGSVTRRPKNERGVISPKPTVEIAVCECEAQFVSGSPSTANAKISLTDNDKPARGVDIRQDIQLQGEEITYHAAAGMD